MSQPLLLLEDNADIARVLTTILRFEGYEVSHEKDGLRGLEAARRRDWSAIVLDLNLPRLSGWDILAALEADGPGHAPVIVVSATAEATRREEALRRGAVEYLVKPVTADVVARTVNQHAREKQAAKTDSPGR
jgi:two-component system OmpR family response regulator/two-component system response regulator QseB